MLISSVTDCAEASNTQIATLAELVRSIHILHYTQALKSFTALDVLCCLYCVVLCCVVCSPSLRGLVCLRGCLLRGLVWFMPVLSSGQKTEAITRFVQGCRVCYLSSCWTQPHIQTYRGAESMASHRLCFQPANDAQSNHWCVHCVKNINS